MENKLDFKSINLNNKKRSISQMKAPTSRNPVITLDGILGGNENSFQKESETVNYWAGVRRARDASNFNRQKDYTTKWQEVYYNGGVL